MLALRRMRPWFLVVAVLFVGSFGLTACDAPDAKHKAAGNLYFQQRKYAEARAEYEKAVAANPKDPGGHILLGNALFELGDHAGARRAYEEALRLDEGAAEAHRGLAILIAHTARPGDRAAFDAFMRHIEAVVARHPKDRNAVVSAAQVLSEKANPADRETYLAAQRRAEELLRSVLPLDDRDPRTLFTLALVYARKGDVKTALRVGERLHQVAPDKGYGPYTSAVIYTLVGEHEKALVSVEELLKLDVIDPETLRRDSLLAPLSSLPRFGELIDDAGDRRKGRR